LVLALNAYVNINNQTAEESPLISIRNLQLEYKSGSKKLKVLENVNLNVDTGEFICVLGPSGCGKSSLLRIIAGYESPAFGEVKINDQKHMEPNAEEGF
jgi:taurine transport system ATP-binding protein